MCSVTNEELVEKIQQGIDVQENMGILYEQNKKLIYKFVFPYSKKIEIEDLMQEAYFGIHQAALRFDINSENKFMSYAQYWIIAKINRYYRNNGRLKRLPDSIIEQISNYYRFVDEHKKMHDEEKPNDAEIIQSLNISQKQLDYIKKIITEDTMVSLQSPTIENSTLENVIADKTILEEQICDDLMQEQLKNDLWNEVDALDNEKQKNVIKMRYKENKSLNDIAIIENVTRERIRQIEENGLKILRQKENIINIGKEFYYNTSMIYSGNYTSFKYNGSVVENMVIKKIRTEKEMWARIQKLEERKKKLLASMMD